MGDIQKKRTKKYKSVYAKIEMKKKRIIIIVSRTR